MIASDLIAALERGYTVLAPTARLTRELHRDYAAYQSRSGNSTWQTPAILSLGAWLRRQFDTLVWQGPDATRGRLLLGAPAAQALWQRVIESRTADGDLLDAPAATRLAFAAWKLIQEWRLPDPGAAPIASEDLKQFSVWMRVYHDTTLRQNYIDDARLPDIVRGAIQVGALEAGQIALHAFGEIGPQLDGLWQAVLERDGEVMLLERDVIDPEAVCVEMLNEREEFEQAARWARRQVETRGDDAAIGVIVPGLSERRPIVEGAFGRVFAPAGSLPGAADLRRGFALVCRAPVAETPVGAAALAILNLARHRMDLESVRSVVLSPFVGASSDEYIARGEFVAWLGRYPRSRTSLERLAGRAAAWAAEGKRSFALTGLLEGVLAEVGDRNKQKPGAWGNRFGRMLNAAGWPGTSLDATGADAREAVRTALAQMGSLDPVLTRIDVGAALAHFRRLIESAELPGERSPVPVRVLEPDVAQGLHFDAAWICGWTMEACPRAAEPNPFIPQGWAREKGLPGSSAARMLGDARRITKRLITSAPDVVVSWPRETRHSEQEKSSLISHLREVSKEDLEVWEGPGAAHVVAASAQAERVVDAAGPELTGTRVRGGTRSLKLQAACPFLAFATCRLGAEASPPVGAGLDPRERGSVVHGVLEKTWRELESHSGLLSMQREDIEERLQGFVDGALTRIESRRGRLPERFRDIEQRRLVHLVLDWLELERGRQSFVVVAEESKRILSLGGLEFELVPDRIDRIDDAGLVLIDYKTSRNNSERLWAGSRPDEPQLPMYVLTLNEPVLAILFAEVRSDQMRFRGAAKMAGLVPGVGKFKGLGNDDVRWDQLRDYWRGHLETLAREFRRGVASVDPKSRAATCRYCDLDALCRIGEREKAWVDDA